MRVKKKPIVVEAIQWTGENLSEVIDLIGLHPSVQELSWGEYARLVNAEGLKIFTLEGTMMASIGDYIIKGVNGECYPCKPDIFAKTYEPVETPINVETPAPDFPANRLLNAFPRPDALNEIYATGDVDHRGVPVNYSIWRGNHSIMGMTGILFQKGFVEEGDYQEGVEDIDLLEMVYDRLSLLADYLEGTDDCMIDTALLNIAHAIGNLAVYEKRCRETGEASEY